MDLPYFFHECIPLFQNAYLETPPSIDETWSNLLKPYENKIIGINWRGSAGHPNDRNRSANIGVFEPLSKAGTLISLDLEEPPQTSFDVLNACGGFVSAEYTASLITQLDVVVTVDSFIAHLAGSLGIKTFILLPLQNEWRWGNGETQIWYNSVTLVKQTTKGDWTGPIQKVLGSL
jgi:hypothetical protein